MPQYLGTSPPAYERVDLFRLYLEAPIITGRDYFVPFAPYTATVERVLLYVLGTDSITWNFTFGVDISVAAGSRPTLFAANQVTAAGAGPPLIISTGFQDTQIPGYGFAAFNVSAVGAGVTAVGVGLYGKIP